MPVEPVRVVEELLRETFAGAEVAFLAGSVLRGEGTAGSDLDVVVIYPRLSAAYRQSLRHGGWPVEAFVHDPETLGWFLFEENRPDGVPSLAAMVDEGEEIPGPTALSRECKRLARRCLELGPPPWSERTREDKRYALTDLADDLRHARNPGEFRATAARLGEQLADYMLRSRGLWSARGKTLPRRLAQVDPSLAQRYALALVADVPGPLVELTREVIGSWNFEGYRREAPSHWRRPVLRTARLVVRPPYPDEDIQGFNAENAGHLQATDTARPVGELSEQALRLWILLEDELIGTINLTQIFRGPFQAAYLGFALAERHQSQGLMSEALRAVIRYAFDELKLHRLMANHLPENERCARLLARLGFLTEGLAPDYLCINGRWRDHVLTALTRSQI